MFWMFYEIGFWDFWFKAYKINTTWFLIICVGWKIDSIRSLYKNNRFHIITIFYFHELVLTRQFITFQTNDAVIK